MTPPAGRTCTAPRASCGRRARTRTRGPRVCALARCTRDVTRSRTHTGSSAFTPTTTTTTTISCAHGPRTRSGTSAPCASTTAWPRSGQPAGGPSVTSPLRMAASSSSRTPQRTLPRSSRCREARPRCCVPRPRPRCPPPSSPRPRCSPGRPRTARRLTASTTRP